MFMLTTMMKLIFIVTCHQMIKLKMHKIHMCFSAVYSAIFRSMQCPLQGWECGMLMGSLMTFWFDSWNFQSEWNFYDDVRICNKNIEKRQDALLLSLKPRIARSMLQFSGTKPLNRCATKLLQITSLKTEQNLIQSKHLDLPAPQSIFIFQPWPTINSMSSYIIPKKEHRIKWENKFILDG